MTTATVPLSLKIDSDLKERLKNIASRRSRTPHALAREAIYSYVNQVEELDAWNQVAVESLEHYRRT
jgi:predicted transcriptional regulator